MSFVARCSLMSLDYFDCIYSIGNVLVLRYHNLHSLLNGAMHRISTDSFVQSSILFIVISSFMSVCCVLESLPRGVYLNLFK